MTRAAAPRLRGTVSPRRPQWARVAHRHLQVYVFLWLWFWVICAVGSVAAIAVVDRFGTVNVSIIQFVRNGPLVWFLFSLAIIVATAYLAPHVANGMTRRSFVRGALAAVGASAVLNTLTAAGLLLLEGALYDRMGWQHDTRPGPEYEAGIWEEGLGVLLLDHGLATLAGGVSGLLVGIAYYRLGGWWGTLALPLTLLPILAVMFLTSWSAPFMPWHLGEPLGNALGILLVLGAAVAFALLTRRIPIARTES